MNCSCVCHNAFVRVTWLNRIYDMTYSYLWNNVFICVISLIHMCSMSHTCAWRDLFKYVTHLIHTRDMPHLCEWHASFTLAHLNHSFFFFFLSLLPISPLQTETYQKETHKMGIFPQLKKERNTLIKLEIYFLTVTRLQSSGLNICIHTARFITDDWRIQDAEKTGKRYMKNRW